MRPLLAIATTVLLTSSALAQTAPTTSEQDHAAHHPSGSSASASAPAEKAGSKAASKSSAGAPSRAQMDARTREERQTLMPEHMKTMQAGMSMMGERGGKGAMGPDAMSKRMDMMEMMMDREATQSSPVK
jgi:hypothetical protein